MGAFNTLVSDLACPNCSRRVRMRIQFKYGDTRQYEYEVGDEIRWGGNDIGEPGHKKVVVDGAGEPCPACGSSGNFEVVLCEDRIELPVVASGRYDFVGKDETYLVLENSGH